MRLFTAICLDHAVKAEISRWVNLARRNAGGRFIRPENMHITLCFLGEQPESCLDGVSRVIEGAVEPGFEIAFPGVRRWARPFGGWA